MISNIYYVDMPSDNVGLCSDHPLGMQECAKLYVDIIQIILLLK